MFDDSSVANHEKYYRLLETTKTHSELFYVGPHEKEAFTDLVRKRLRDRKLDAAVRNLFRPSYGGNRNFALIYTLGGHAVSSDDDMRPYALLEDSPESLAEDEISRGKLIRANGNGYTQRPMDILSAFRDVLGRKVADLPPNFATGELVVDTAMDLETEHQHHHRPRQLPAPAQGQALAQRGSRWRRRSARAPTTSTPSSSRTSTWRIRTRCTRTS